MQTHYDYIILGAGLSGLTTALRMARDPFFSKKSIAIIDQDLNKSNDRTWCFWEIEPSMYEAIVSYTWPSVLIKGEGVHSHIDIAPYTYKKIESAGLYVGVHSHIDIAPYTYKKIESAGLYAFAKAELSQHSNITFIEGSVSTITTLDGKATVTTDISIFESPAVLNSIYKPSLLKEQTQAVVLQQHFIGWFVKTEKPVFDPKQATYMDFSIPQEGNCRFMYVLPTSTTEALLEYTLFSEKLLPKTEYENAIKTYLKNLGVENYEIIDREQGSIPMTTYYFTQHNTPHVLHIGTAGGWTKASTGYTFTHTLKKSKDLITFLKTNSRFTTYSLANRWRFYDAVLLEVLAKHNEQGASIFTRMFKKGKASHIFRFLDEESSLADELKVVLSAPKIPFLKAALKVVFK